MRHLLKLFLVMVLLSMFAFSQSITSGDITGVITDPSGAVVPNAKVTATNDATGQSQTVTSNGEGIYRFSFLKPGSYTVAAAASGFQNSTRKVQVGLGQASTVNISMAVASATTTVEVTVNPLQVENADNSTLFGSEQIALVPNPGNDLSAVAQTSPGAVMNTAGGQGNFSSFGLPGTSNLFTLDGQNDNDPFLNLNNSGATNLLLGTNEVQEATVVTNGYSGQYGQLAGAQVNYVTKSGSNDFHGNAVYYWNGRVMNANDFINNLSSTPRPFDNVNQWAVSFGGPIKKDKTFFFFDYEGLRVVLPTSQPAFIPSQQFQAATIANLTASGLSASVPFYQQIFSLYNAAAGAATATPSTNCGDAGVTALPAATPCVLQFTSTAGNFTHEYLAALRIDHKFSDKDSIFARVQNDHGLQATVTDPISPLFNVQSDQPEYQGQLGWTRLVSSNSVNEFKVSGQWYSALFTNANRAATLAAFPTVLQLGDGSLSNVGGAIGEIFPQGRNVTQYQIVDDYSFTKGNHTWKVGVNYHRNDVTDFGPQEFTAGIVIPNSLNDFFNGGATGDILQQNFPSRPQQPIALYGLGVYGQDEWRATKNLKLTLALRLEHNSNPVCQTNCFARLVAPFTSLDHTNSENIPYNQTIISGLHQAYPATDGVVWQPRLGFTYSPFGSAKTVIRGGVGIFADAFPAAVADSLLTNPPVLASFVVGNAPISPAEAGNVFQLAQNANKAFQSGFATGGTASSLGLIGAAPSFVTTDAKLRQPRYQEWNLQVEQNLGWNTVLGVNYVGNHGIFEPVQNNGVNAFGFPGLPDGQVIGGIPVGPDARFGTVTQIQSIAVSNYNGLVTTLRHQFSHGLAFQTNYTWSHALDEISNGGLLSFNLGSAPSLTFPINPFNIRQNYGNADYDVRHYFSMNYVWDNSLRHLFHWGPNAIFGGWTVSGTIFARSGLPFSVVDNRTSNALRGNNYGGTLLPSVIGAATNGSCGEPNAIPTATSNPPSCLNPGGFSASLLNPAKPGADSVISNQERNQFRGPNYINTDMSIMKYTKLAERANVGVGVQFFNLFNHPNFDLPVNSISNSLFGTITRTVSTPTSILGSFLGGDASPRLIQVKAEFKF
jgi:outer membrane receptor protein involved in Fe transport